jgi:hypothetical protein
LTTESRESKNLFSVTSTSTYLHESREFNESTRNSDLPFFDLNIIVAATPIISLLLTSLEKVVLAQFISRGGATPGLGGPRPQGQGFLPKKKKKIKILPLNFYFLFF